MKTRQTTTGIELRSTPGGMWGLGLWLVAGGTLCLAMIVFRPAGLGPTERLLGGLLGAGVMAGGLYALSTSWATRLYMDMVRRRMRFERRAPFRRRVVIEAPFEHVNGTQIQRRPDSDGDVWCDVLLLVTGHDPLPLDSWPEAHASGPHATAGAIQSALRGSRITAQA